MKWRRILVYVMIFIVWLILTSVGGRQIYERAKAKPAAAKQPPASKAAAAPTPSQPQTVQPASAPNNQDPHAVSPAMKEKP